MNAPKHTMGARLIKIRDVASPCPSLIRPGDRVRLRKPHPCGGDTWTIVRVGADVGLVCCTCGQRILLTRRAFERRLARISRAQPTNSGAQS